MVGMSQANASADSAFGTAARDSSTAKPSTDLDCISLVYDGRYDYARPSTEVDRSSSQYHYCVARGRKAYAIDAAGVVATDGSSLDVKRGTRSYGYWVFEMHDGTADCKTKKAAFCFFIKYESKIRNCIPFESFDAMIVYFLERAVDLALEVCNK